MKKKILIFIISLLISLFVLAFLFVYFNGFPEDREKAENFAIMYLTNTTYRHYTVVDTKYSFQEKAYIITAKPLTPNDEETKIIKVFVTNQDVTLKTIK